MTWAGLGRLLRASRGRISRSCSSGSRRRTARRLGRGLRPCRDPVDQGGARHHRRAAGHRARRARTSTRSPRHAACASICSAATVRSSSPSPASRSRSGTSAASAPASRCIALLGGRRRRPSSNAYASLLRYGDPELVARNTAAACARGYRHIKLHEVTREAVLAREERARRRRLPGSCSTSIAPGRPGSARRWPSSLRERRAALAGGAGLAAGGLRRACARAPARHSDRGGRERRRPLRLQVADRRRRDRHRAAERHQDRRHRRDAGGHRSVPRATVSKWRRTAPISARASSRRCTSSPRSCQRPLVEVLWLDMEAQPVRSMGARPSTGACQVPQGPGLGCDPDPGHPRALSQWASRPHRARGPRHEGRRASKPARSSSRSTEADRQRARRDRIPSAASASSFIATPASSART